MPYSKKNFDSWKQFGPITLPVKHRSASETVYKTWLDDNVRYHEEESFDTLSHVTNFIHCEKIFQEGLKIQKLVDEDYSCVTKVLDTRGFEHPLRHVEFLWVGPDTKENDEAMRYGNVKFCTKQLEFLNDLNFYIVEILDYVATSCVRILVTRRQYNLRRFDPFEPVDTSRTPCFYREGEWFRHLSFTNSREREISLGVEFLLDNIPSQHLFTCKYVICCDPRARLSSTGRSLGKISTFNDSADILRLVLLLVRYQGLHPYSFVRTDVFYKLLSAIQFIECEDEVITEESCLDVVQTYSGSSPDRIISSIDFSDSFQTGFIRSEDRLHIQLLDNLFDQYDQVPNGHTMINVICKGLEAMKDEKNIHSLFGVFFKHFSSRYAKMKVKQTLLSLFCSI